MKKVILVITIILIIILLGAFGINFYVKASTKKQIIKDGDYTNLNDVDCIIILGAGIWGDKPSHMLEDRLLEGINLYNKNISNNIIMSGHHGKVDYDEVNLMKKFAIEKGVLSEDVFMDHAGFSTYESLYRAKEIFGAKKIVIVTQKYHLYRALYVARSLGIEAYGVASNQRDYAGQIVRDLREVLARDKDFFTSIIKPKPTYLGEKISLDGSGDITNDK